MRRPHLLRQQATRHIRSSSWVALVGLYFSLCLTGASFGQQDWSEPPVRTIQTPTTLNAPGNSPFERPITVGQQPAAESSAADVDQASLEVGTKRTTLDLTDPKQVSEELGAAASENSKEIRSLFARAVFDNDREAQVELGSQYLSKILIIFAIMFLASRVANFVRDLVTRVVSSHTDETIGRFAGTLAKSAVMLVALMMVLNQFGFETTSFAALIAALGFAVGMALQGTLGNFASGIALLVFRPFNVGDFITIAGESGTVRAIGLFTTSMDTPDNRHIIIPNDSVFGNKIENCTYNSVRRVDVTVGVSYSAGIQHTRQVLTEAIAELDGASTERESQVCLSELNASSVDWTCRVWCRPTDYLAVKERMTEAVKLALDASGIGIPFPQLDLHVIAAANQQKLAA